MKAYAILLTLLIFCSYDLYSQNYVDVLKIDYNYSGSNNFVDEEVASDVKELVVDLTVPVPLNDKMALLTGILYENVSITPYVDESEINVHTASLKLGVNKTFNEKWSMTFLLLPKFSSDLKMVGSEDLQLGTVALFKLVQNENFNYKFGLYYNSELFGTFIVPFFGLYYQTGPWEVKTLLPANFDVNYTFSDPWRVGLRFNGFIKSFHLNDTFGNGLNQYLTKSNNEVGLYAGVSLGSVNLEFMAGRSIGRKYRTYEVNDKMDFALSILKFNDNRTQLNTDFLDGMVLKTSLIYRVQISPKK